MPKDKKRFHQRGAI